jgi:2-methylcitrate dehydratase
MILVVPKGGENRRLSHPASPERRPKATDMDNLTRQLATFAASLTYEQIPLAILHHARRSLVDSLACAFGGIDCEAARIGRRIADGATPRHHPGAIIGSSARAPAEEAAFLNTVMIRYLDFNDAWHAGHPSDMLGGLLALTGSAGVANGEAGKRLLTAMVAAYEVAFQMIPPTQMREKGWDQGYVIGIAATCGIGNLLGLSADKLAHAIAITAVANVPMRNTRAGKLSLWKGAATAFAIRNAVFATLLAADGMTGPDAPFEGRHGLWEQVTGPFELDKFGVDGGEWKFPWIRLKYWPVEYNAQAGVWAALRLREEFAHADIASIDIATYWSAWHEIGSEPEKWDPTTRETADHSLPFIFARALVDGTITLASFEEAAYRDPSLRQLMGKIAVHEDAAIEALFPAQIVMRVEAVATDGRRRSIEISNPRGDNTNPMDDAEVAAKFHGLTAPVLGVEQSARAFAAWNTIDTGTGLDEAMALLVPPVRQGPA